MKVWLIGGTAAALVGVGLYLSSPKPAAPNVLPAGGVPVTEVKPESPPATPVSHPVVDVADLDALLDPPAIPLAGTSATGPILILVGYEEPPPPARTGADVPPIPKASSPSQRGPRTTRESPLITEPR